MQHVHSFTKYCTDDDKIKQPKYNVGVNPSVFLWDPMCMLRTHSKTQTEVECTCSVMQCTLQHAQCTCSIGCSYTSFLYTARTLPTSGSVFAAYFQPTLQLHWNYTANTLHFGQRIFRMVTYSDRPIIVTMRHSIFLHTDSWAKCDTNCTGRIKS